MNTRTLFFLLVVSCLPLLSHQLVAQAPYSHSAQSVIYRPHILKRQGTGFQLFWDGAPPPDEALRCFTEASNIISSLIQLKEPVRVKAKWSPLQAEGDTTILGSASPMDFCEYNSSNRLLPSALLRQLGDDSCAKFDIGCTFNSEVRWNTDPSKTKLDEGETDLTSVVLHEFMHGIGFSGLISANGNGRVGSNAPDGKAVKFDENLFVMMDSSNASSVLEGPWNDLAEPLSSGELVYVVQLPSDSERYAVPMYSPSTFEPGRSVYHVDIDRAKDPDNQLMLPDLPMGLVVRHPGPAALAILQSIGFQLVNQAEIQSLGNDVQPGPSSTFNTPSSINEPTSRRQKSSGHIDVPSQLLIALMGGAILCEKILG